MELSLIHIFEKRRQRLEELETVIAEPDFFNDQKTTSEIMREHRRLKELMETWDSLNAVSYTHLIYSSAHGRCKAPII